MPPSPAPSRLSALLSGPGDLVPKVECHCRPTDPLLPRLLSELVDKRAAVSGRWEAADLPLDNPTRPPLHLPASTCAVQLANGMVGVLKIQQNGDCTLFVRLLRAQTNAWADNHKQPHSGARMFWRALEDHQVYPILAQAHPFVLEPNQVHHPYVLSILCLMSRERWTVPPAADAPLLPTNKGRFTLVGLPPLPEHFEQCLLLLGCTEAFVDDEEGDAPLSARTAIKNVWGDTPRPLIAQDAADMFAFAGEDLSTHANPGIFTRVIPALNKHAPEAKAVKTAWAECWRDARPGNDDDEEEVPDEDEEAEEGEEGEAEPTVPARGARPPVTLASSDDEDAPLRRAEEAHAEARALDPPHPIARPKGAASSSSSSSTTASVAPAPAAAAQGGAAKKGAAGKAKLPPPKPLKPPKAKPKPRKPTAKPRVVVRDDDDSDADGGNDDGGSVGKQDADLTDVDESSEEEDTSSESSSSDDDRPPRRPAKRARHASSDDDDDDADEEEEEEDDDEGEEAPALAPATSPQVTDLLIQMAKPCHDKLQRMLRNHGPLLLARYHNQLLEDMGLLQTARSPVALLAAALSIVSTLADVHSDRARGDSTLVHRAEARRLGEMATQTKEFAEAVRALLEGAGEA